MESRNHQPNPRRMRVLALVPPSKEGLQASEHSVLDFELQRLASRGLSVHTISPFAKESRECKGVVIHPVPRLRSLTHACRSLLWLSQAHSDVYRGGRLFHLAKMLASINHVVCREQIDIVYSPFAYPELTAGLPATKAYRTPVVVSLRGADVFVEETARYGSTRDPGQQRIISSTLREADHVIGVSRALVKRAIELGACESNTTVVLKGVDESRFVPGNAGLARQKVNLPNKPTILYVGRLHPVKGVDCLMDAFEHISKVIGDVQLVICGDGSQTNHFKNRVRDNGLSSNVHFAGNVGREVIPYYFQACDVFVLPSLSEGSGNVLLEAAACGKPSIGADVGGIPDYIDDGVTGLLFRKADAQELAAKAIAVLSNQELATRMGCAARDHVEMHHRYDHMLEQLERVFLRVVDQSRAPSKALSTV